MEVVLVGIARVALQEHFPTDLMGGLLGGIAALGVYAWFTRPGGWADRPPLAGEDDVSDGPEAPAGSAEGGPLGEDEGNEPGHGPTTPAQPRTKRELGLATATVVIGFAILAACLFVFGSLAQGVRSKDVFPLDAWATPFLHGISSPAMDAAMNAITTLGTVFVILPALVVLGVWLLRTGRVRSLVYLVVTILGSLVLQLTSSRSSPAPGPTSRTRRSCPTTAFRAGTP